MREHTLMTFEPEWHVQDGGGIPALSRIRFLFARRCLPSESTKHVDALRESAMFAPAIVFVTNDEVTHYRKLAESEGKRLQRRRSLCQEAFFVFSGCTWKTTGFVHAVCMRGED